MWTAQLVALRALDRLGFAETVDRLAERLAAHPSPELQAWLRDRARAAQRMAAGEALVTENGGVELLLIPSGHFMMGSPPSEEGHTRYEEPPHRVSVSEFYLGRYAVTNEEYRRFRAATPDIPEPTNWGDRRFNGERQPVVGVSWSEARRFAAWAGGRLPTEAEWEYAARAGTTAPYLTGASDADLSEVGWYMGNSDGQPQPVGQKSPNAWGLYDVLGNVFEWVEDTWHKSYQGAPTDGSSWVDEGGTDRVIGGILAQRSGTRASRRAWRARAALSI